MNLRAVIAVTAACLFGASAFSGAQNPEPVPVEPGGGAAGGDALVLNNWDIRGVRNIQGGSLANPPESLNLDIGAGSTANPGDLVLNYDVGRRTLIYDGRKHLVASFGPTGIRFYKKVSGYEASFKGCGRWCWGRRRRSCCVLSRSGGR